MGGLNLSGYRGDEAFIWKLKMNPVGGVGIELDLTYKTLFEVDILFFPKGSLTGPSVREENHVLYTLCIPILLRSKLFHGTSPYFVGGIEVSPVMAYIQKSEGQESIDLGGTVKKFDYGVVFGGGFEMELKQELFLFIEARYHLGLNNLLVDPEGGVTRKTMAFVLLIGVRS